MINQELLIWLKDNSNRRIGRLRIVAETEADPRGQETTISSDRDLESKNVPIITSIGGFPSYPIALMKGDLDPSRLLILLREETEYQIGISRFLTTTSVCNDDFSTLREFSNTEDWMIKRSLLRDEPDATDYLLNFRSYVGRSSFDFVIEGRRSKPYPFLVRSRKIDYLDDFGKMLSDISDFSSGLLLDPNSPLYHMSGFDERQRSCRYEDYLFLEYIMREENVPSAISRISKNPHTRIHSNDEIRPIPLCSNPILDSLSDVTYHVNWTPSTSVTGRASNTSFLSSLASVKDRSAIETTDTPENRTVKFFISEMQNLCQSLRYSWGSGKNPGIARRLDDIDDELTSILDEEWLRDVGEMAAVPGNSQVLMRRAGYRKISELLRMMNFSARFEWRDYRDVVDAHSLRLSTLYEIWCYIVLVKILEKISDHKVKADDLFEKTADDWEIRLKRDTASTLEFTPKMKSEKRIRVILLMNSHFSKGSKYPSYSFQHRPDYSLVVSRLDESSSEYCLVHFDAKYRTRIEEADNPEERDEDVETIIPKYPWVSDINKMHTYKDAILRTQGSYTLFPGNRDRLFAENIADGIEKSLIPSVGAISLSPSSQKDVMNLEKWIERLLESLACRIL